MRRLGLSESAEYRALCLLNPSYSVHSRVGPKASFALALAGAGFGPLSLDWRGSSDGAHNPELRLKCFAISFVVKSARQSWVETHSCCWWHGGQRI